MFTQIKRKKLIARVKTLQERYPHAFPNRFGYFSRIPSNPHSIESMDLEKLKEICRISEDEMAKEEQSALDSLIENRWQDNAENELINYHSDSYFLPGNNVSPFSGGESFYDYLLSEIVQEKGGIVKFIHIRESIEDNSLPAFVRVEQEINGERTIVFDGEIPSLPDHSPLNENEERALSKGYFDDLLLRFYFNLDGTFADPFWSHAFNMMNPIETEIDLEKIDYGECNAHKSDDDYFVFWEE